MYNARPVVRIVTTGLFSSARYGGAQAPAPLRAVPQAWRSTDHPLSSLMRTVLQSSCRRTWTSLPPTACPTWARAFHSSSCHLASRSSVKQLTEHGLAFSKTPLNTEDLGEVFGTSLGRNVALGNRLLRVLHGRRVDGALDRPLPPDLTRLLHRYPRAFDVGLQWLRDHYPIDEDAAIMARLDREEAGYEEDVPSELQHQAQSVGRYNMSGPHVDQSAASIPPADTEYYGPQSGQYDVQLSERGDVFGPSEFDRIRARNEARAKQDEEELEKQIAEIQERHVERINRDTAVTNRSEQAVTAAEQEFRPPNEFDKWVLRARNRATSKLTLDSDQIQNTTMARRLIPSFLFVAGGGVALYLFTLLWDPPNRMDRWMKDYSLSFATVAGIVGANLVIFCLWKLPPAWPLLNRYFLVVAATPKPISLLGNLFSHMKVKHLASNMLFLLVFGPSLHEDLGRADFLALYLFSGMVGSYLSFASHVTRGVLTMTGLGASGCIWGVVAAFFNLHAEDYFTPIFLPPEMKENWSVKGWMFLVSLLTFEAVGVFTRRLSGIDYVAHLGGAATGWMLSALWKQNHDSTQKHGSFVPKPTQNWWHFLSQSSGKDKGV